MLFQMWKDIRVQGKLFKIKSNTVPALGIPEQVKIPERDKYIRGIVSRNIVPSNPRAAGEVRVTEDSLNLRIS